MSVGKSRPSPYEIALSALKSGDLEKTSRLIREWRTEDGAAHVDAPVLRWLMQTRMQLKSGLPIEEYSPPHPPRDPYLTADIPFVLGLVDFHHGKWIAGAVHFAESARLFLATGATHRYLFSLYNRHIGLVNSDFPPPPEALDELIRLALTHADSRILLLAYRQKAYDFYWAGKFEAASRYAKRALRSGARTESARSDTQLILLLHALIELKRRRPRAARADWEEIPDQVDPRVDFARAVVAHFLGEKPILEGQNFPVRDPFFERVLKKSDLESARIPKKATEAYQRFASSLRPRGMESRILRLLERGPKSKAHLVESLYGPAGEPKLVDNRLHRLVSRINNKRRGLISFEKGHYHLQTEL